MAKVKLPEWYAQVGTTDKAYTKPVKIGGRVVYTAINATYQMIKATEVLGMYGDTWGVKEPTFDVIRDGVANKPVLLTLDAIFYYPIKEGDKTRTAEFPISTDARMYTTSGNIVDDLRKKLLTDITTKALSKIGFNVDVFLGLFDDQKYQDGLPTKDKSLAVPKSLPVKMARQMRTLIDSTQLLSECESIKTRLKSYVEDESSREILKLANDKQDILQTQGQD